MSDLAVGDLIAPLPGTTWCGRDIGGEELRVHQVHPFPAAAGGTLYLACPAHWTPSSTDPHLQHDQFVVIRRTVTDTPPQVPASAGSTP